MTAQGFQELFDRLERVWHEDQHDLVADCVAPLYVRHDEAGTRRITPDEFADEVIATKRSRPNIRFTIHDHGIAHNRAWFRLSMTWSDAASGEKRTRAGFQVFRIEDGLLAETWIMLFGLDSSWPDAAGQQRWTSPYWH